MHSKAINIISMHVRMHMADQSLSMMEALAIVKDFVNSKGVSTVSSLPVNEVWDHAIEICRLMAVAAKAKKERAL